MHLRGLITLMINVNRCSDGLTPSSHCRGAQVESLVNSCKIFVLDEVALGQISPQFPLVFAPPDHFSSIAVLCVYHPLPMMCESPDKAAQYHIMGAARVSFRASARKSAYRIKCSGEKNIVNTRYNGPMYNGFRI